MAKIFFLFTIFSLTHIDSVYKTLALQTRTFQNQCIQKGTDEANFACTEKKDACDSGASVTLPKWLENDTFIATSARNGKSVAHMNTINVSNNGTGTPYLDVFWTLTNDTDSLKYVNLTRAFLLHMKRSSEENGCVLFDFQSSYFGEVIPIFKYREVVLETGFYNFTLTSLPSKQYLSYNITVPQTIFGMTNNSNSVTLESWKTVLAAAANHYTGVIEVVFQPAPSEFNVSFYKITHTESSMFISTPVKRNLAQLRFPIRIPTTYESRKYIKVVLEVIGRNACTDGCIAAENVTVVMLPRPSDHEISGEGTTVSFDTTSVGDNAPIMVTTSEPDGEEISIGKIVGGIVGAVVFIVIVVCIVYCVYKRKHKDVDSSYAMKRLDNDFDTDSKTPSVLILYSYDCPAHEQCVIEFANFLKTEWHLEVHLDLWQQKDIIDRGDKQWLNEKIIMSQFVIVISSTGARYKCARNRQFRMKYDRPVPDMFTYAVDLVLERCRASKVEMNQVGTSSHPPLECLVIGFNYSCANDIPPKLDTLPRFVLVKELYQLYCHLCRVTPAEKLPTNFNAVSPSKFKYTKSGKQLSMVLAKANDFFENNPDWLAELLEPVSPQLTTEQQKQQQQKKNQQQPDDSQPDPNVHSEGKVNVIESVNKGHNSTHMHNNQGGSQTHSRMSSNLSATEEDALLEERKKKRLKEEEAKMERIVSSSKLKEMLNSSGGPTNVSMHPSGGTSESPNGEVSNGRDHSTILSVPNNSDKVSIKSHSRNNSDYSSLNRSGNSGGTTPAGVVNNNRTDGAESSIGDNDKSIDDLDAEELQRDIDFIHNNYYDPYKQDWEHPSNPDDILVNMDFTGYTPPENVPLSLTYQKFGEYNNLGLTPLSAVNNNSLKLNGGPDLDFTNPMYFKMNGDAGDHLKENNHNNNNKLQKGYNGELKSDRNDNFIVDFEIPPEKLQQISSNKDRKSLTSESSDIGTRL